MAFLVAASAAPKALWLCLGLSACGTPWALGGQEFDDDVGSENSPASVDTHLDTDLGGDTVGGPEIYLSGVSCDDAPADPPLVATGGTARIDVDHSGVVHDCNTEWRLSASADAAALRIDAWYSPTLVEASDCQCYWRFEYAIAPVSPGAWTLGVQGASASVAVE